jgi:NAD(P)-dependent dehydrogenase (short-subunit alcohol dehydrogenase family)
MLAIVTGASRGLGPLCPRELAAHGVNLLLVARNQTALACVAVETTTKCPGCKVRTLGCDLRDPDASERVREAADQLGQVAAVQGPIGSAWEGAMAREWAPKTMLWEYPFADRSWAREIAEFVTAICGRRPPIGDAAEAVCSMSVIERIY